ncbi:MAG: GNAT family N-acetyltransferase [Dongiaceae bacterium]
MRPLGPFDLAIAAALHADSFDDVWSERALAELLAMPGAFGMLAFFDHQPAGLVIAMAVGPDAEVLTLCVAPACRRRGIAGRLLTAVADRARDAGCERLLLEVAEDNEAAGALYHRLGFVKVGRRPAYYRRSAESAAATILAWRLQS